MNNSIENDNEFLSDKVVGLMLAGGQSRRMGGGDKCLMKFGSRNLLDHVIQRLENQVEVCLLNANGDHSRFSEYNLPIISDSVEGYAGPLAGVLSGMIWTRKNLPSARWIASIATDTPFFPTDLISKFLIAVSQYPTICLASTSGRVHPVFGLWPMVLAEDLDKALRGGTRKVLDWTDRHPTKIVEFPMIEQKEFQIDPFFNTNHPADLVKANEIRQKLTP